MSSIEQFLQSIRTAIHARTVRNEIANAIEQCYDENVSLVDGLIAVRSTLNSVAKMSDAYESFRIIVAVGGISPEGAPNTTNRKQRKGFKGYCVYLKKGSMITTDGTICKMRLVRYSSSLISVSTFVSMSPDYLESYTIEEDGYYTLLFAKDDNTEITDNEHANIEASTYLTVAKTNGQGYIPFATYSRDITNTFVGVMGSQKAVLTAVSGDSGFYKIRTANNTVFKCCLCGENDVFVESSGSTTMASKETALEKTNRIFIAMQKPNFTEITVNDVVTFISDLSVAFFPNETERAYSYTGQRVTLGQTFDYRFLGKVAQYGGGSKTLQGMAQYEGKLIVLYDTGYYNVYAISPFNSTALGSGLLESTDNALHCNACSIGAMHIAGDPFPFLYVTGSNDLTPGYCSVERIKPDYTNEHIQTISIDYTNFAQEGYTEEFARPNFYVDRGYLYTFSAKYRTNGSEEAHDSENRFVIHKYALPDTSIATVTLTAADVMAEYILPYTTFFQQGGTTHNGKLFQVFGCGGVTKGSKQALNALRVYNLDGGYEIAQIDLSQVPASNEEIESAAVFGNELLLNYITGNVYILTF